MICRLFRSSYLSHMNQHVTVSMLVLAMLSKFYFSTPMGSKLDYISRYSLHENTVKNDQCHSQALLCKTCTIIHDLSPFFFAESNTENSVEDSKTLGDCPVACPTHSPWATCGSGQH